jgi:hypothetical protein
VRAGDGPVQAERSSDPERSPSRSSVLDRRGSSAGAVRMRSSPAECRRQRGRVLRSSGKLSRRLSAADPARPPSVPGTDGVIPSRRDSTMTGGWGTKWRRLWRGSLHFAPFATLRRRAGEIRPRTGWPGSSSFCVAQLVVTGAGAAEGLRADEHMGSRHLQRLLAPARLDDRALAIPWKKRGGGDGGAQRSGTPKTRAAGSRRPWAYHPASMPCHPHRPLARNRGSTRCGGVGPSRG